MAGKEPSCLRLQIAKRLVTPLDEVGRCQIGFKILSVANGHL
jgi:hypothetical protein